MHITIVREDNFVLIDGNPQNFELSLYDLPEGLWALQWAETKGEIELSDGNVFIDELPEWTAPLITEHERLTAEQNNQQQQEQRQAVFIMNGAVRADRLKKNTVAKHAAEQNKINDFVRSLMYA